MYWLLLGVVCDWCIGLFDCVGCDVWVYVEDEVCEI